MKFAVNYLRTFIPGLTTDLKLLNNQLINLGLEVEAITEDLNGNTVIDVAVPPNRADLLSIIGIAREVALANQLELQLPMIAPDPALLSPESTKAANLKLNGKQFKFNVENPKACPKYLSSLILGCNNTVTTPDWIAEVLVNSGIKLISPIVDLTNYVMLELGQPLHAFDADLIMDQEIYIRSAKDGEKLLLLNDQNINLTPQDLVIANFTKPLALAGIMGGKQEQISLNTTNVLLECAYFEPIGIRVTSAWHKLTSEAAIRFSRGLDYNLTAVAMQRCIELLTQVVGGEIVGFNNITFLEYANCTVKIELLYLAVTKLLGLEIPPGEIYRILTGLGAKVTHIEQGFIVEPPSWRNDLRIVEDLIEEIARHVGYNKIPPQPPMWPLTFKISSNTHTINFQQELILKHCLVDRGYYEAINYSFIDLELAKKFSITQVFYELTNPISKNMSIMRSSLWPGLVTNLIHNNNRQRARVRLFEMGVVFAHDPISNVVQERLKIAGILSDKLLLENWQDNSKDVDFFAIKNDVIAVANLLGITTLEFKDPTHHALHPYRSASIYLDQILVGCIGALHPRLALELSIETPVYLFELDLYHLLAKKSDFQFKPIIKFPSIRRDFSILVDLDLSIAALSSAVTAALGEYLKELIVFDVYTGKNLPVGKKSIAFGVILQHAEHTLLDEEINQLIVELLNKLQELGIELRAKN